MDKMVLEMMGKMVKVERKYFRYYGHERNIWRERAIVPRAGWIIGIRNIYDYDNVHKTIIRETRKKAWKVCWWPTENGDVYVPLSAVQCSKDIIAVPSTCYLDRQYRAEFAEMMRSWPRTKAGKWVNVERAFKLAVEFFNKVLGNPEKITYKGIMIYVSIDEYGFYYNDLLHRQSNLFYDRKDIAEMNGFNDFVKTVI